MDQPKIERLLRLMKMLAGNVDYSVDELAERLQMSRRTIYRYIDTLKEAGFVIRRVGESFKMLKESMHFSELEQLVHFSEEESFLVNRLIDRLDDTNMLKQNLRKKLASVYNFTAMGDCVVNKENVANTHELIAAIEGKRQATLHSYSSSNRGDIRDRLVEPFAFTTNYIQVWCYEPESGKNKLFKVSRIGNVTVSDTPSNHESEHCSENMDIFRTSGRNGIRIKLALGVMAKNLLLEEYPLAERDLSVIDEEHWQLDTEIYRLEGVGRFVIGIANDITIVEGDALRKYMKEYLLSHCNKLVENDR